MRPRSAPSWTSFRMDVQTTLIHAMPHTYAALQSKSVTYVLLGWEAGPPIRDRLKGQKGGRRSLSQNLF